SRRATKPRSSGDGAGADGERPSWPTSQLQPPLPPGLPPPPPPPEPPFAMSPPALAPAMSIPFVDTGVHRPAMHTPLVHGVPSAFGVTLPQPLAGVQVAASLHSSPAGQTTAAPPVHVPAWHVSPIVQAFPSLHVVPLVAAGFEQVPVAGLQVPATWH